MSEVSSERVLLELVNAVNRLQPGVISYMQGEGIDLVDTLVRVASQITTEKFAHMRSGQTIARKHYAHKVQCLEEQIEALQRINTWAQEEIEGLFQRIQATQPSHPHSLGKTMSDAQVTGPRSTMQPIPSAVFVS